jgi:hypothetical protein
MDHGDEKFAAQEYEAALKAYQAADRIMAVPTTALEVGKTLEKLNRLVEARDAFIRVTRYPQSPGESQAFTTARDTAQRMASEIGPRIPSLELKLTGLPPGADPTVTLDGSPLQADLVGLPIKLNPGKHRVTASAPGFAPAEGEFTLAEGEKKQLELTLKADGSAPAGASSETASDPAAPPDQDSGVEAAPSRTLMWIGFGVGAAGIIAGSVTGLMSLSSAASAKDECDGNRCPPEVQDDIDASKSMATISNIAFAVGAVGIGVGVWQLLTVKDAPSEQTARAPGFALRAEPVIGLGHVGIAGTF